MKYIFLIIIPIIIFNSCATEWFITYNQENKFRKVNISVNESNVVIKNNEDQVVGNVSTNGSIKFYMDYINGDLRKKKYDFTYRTS